ncbi:hypothetical protein MESS4_790048 [Mesorhizobium sp. STM 4661]|nr:hypothetical protein MESS4_790048 [Mesorhizobium sp. STM 4661]
MLQEICKKYDIVGILFLNRQSFAPISVENFYGVIFGNTKRRRSFESTIDYFFTSDDETGMPRPMGRGIVDY